MSSRDLLGAAAAVAAVLAVGCRSTSSAATVGARTCRAAQLRATLAPNGATGGVVAMLRLEHVRGPACRIAAFARAAVRRKDGTLVRPIRGNPAAGVLRARLGRGGSLAVSWVWRNWCGPEQQFVFTAAVGSVRARRAVPTPPRCDDAASGSTFERLATGRR